MKSEMPLIFCADMMRAWLDGRKTMTRRLDGLEKINQDPDAWKLMGWDEFGPHFWNDAKGMELAIPCPYPVGQVRWIRESYWWAGSWDLRHGCDEAGDDPRDYVWHGWEDLKAIRYRVDVPDKPDCPLQTMIWRPMPSIYMYRWMSRESGRVLDHDHRCQRLWEITEADALAEGCRRHECAVMSMATGYRASFMELWQELNGTRKGGMYAWERSPWVWPVKLERLKS